MKQLYCCWGMALLLHTATAQQPPIALSLGERVPPIVITHLLNSETNALNLQGYTNRLVILDFWATYCSACIPALQKLDSLQAQFHDKLKVIGVTYQPKFKVAPFVQKRKWQLTIATDDTLLKQLFPYNAMPHTVWIYHDTVKAFTYPREVTAENINAMLNGHGNKIPLKLDELDFDPQAPLFVNGNGGNGSQQIYRSLITPYLPGKRLSLIKQRDPSGRLTRIADINASLLRLFTDAYNSDVPWYESPARLSIAVKDSSLLYYPGPASATDKQDWTEQHTYTYTLDVPPGFKGDLRQIMQQDLNRFFGSTTGLTAHTEKREMLCWVLTRSDPSILIPNSGHPPQLVSEDNRFYLRQLPFTYFLSALITRNRNLPLPITDETGITGNCTLELNSSLTDFDALDRELKGYGIRLIQKVAPVDILVIQQQYP